MGVTRRLATKPIITASVMVVVIAWAGIACASEHVCLKWPSCSAEFWRNINGDQIGAYLEAGVEINAYDGKGLTALHWAAISSEKTAVIEALADRGADANAPINKTEADLWPLSVGSSPLHAAAAHNSNPAVLIALLDRGAVIDLRDQSDDTPLRKAIHTNNAAVLRLLIERGGDINETTEYGLTPLHSAVMWHVNVTVVELLLDLGPDINAGRGSGATPLSTAVFFGDLATVELLLNPQSTEEMRVAAW